MNNGASLNSTAINGWRGDVTVRIQILAVAQAAGTATSRVFRRSRVGGVASVSSAQGRVWRRSPVAGSASADMWVLSGTRRMVFASVTGVARADAVVRAVSKPITAVRAALSASAAATAVINARRWATSPVDVVASAVGAVRPRAVLRSPVAGSAYAVATVDQGIYRHLPWDEYALHEYTFTVHSEPHIFYVVNQMPIVAKVKQQPNDVQDYDISYDEWFPPDDLIASVALACAPAALVPPSYAIDPSKRVVKVWFYAGGISGTDYKVTVRATTTNDGNPLSPVLRVKEAELIVKIREV